MYSNFCSLFSEGTETIGFPQKNGNSKGEELFRLHGIIWKLCFHKDKF
jgi:hypothetical protein